MMPIMTGLDLDSQKSVFSAPSAAAHTASESQRLAIEAEAQPLLVLAGPGAGKTYCLIERIRFLVERLKYDPERILAFTFTNKAAGEIGSRLDKYLGANADRIRRGTIHAFCAELLREFADRIGLQPGFGIADEDYQLSVLHRLEGYRRWHSRTLKDFCAYRFFGDSLRHGAGELYIRYCEFLEKRNLVDFDMLVLKTAELMRIDSVAAAVRARWDCILVDEFQDLNRAQYAIIRALTSEHRNVFAVGDDEQSIYSWTGADPKLFQTFLNDFHLVEPQCQLGENRRCSREVIALARKLISVNPPMFAERLYAESQRSSIFPITALNFATDDDELAWIISDIRRQRQAYNLQWGDFALLYRTHEIGYAAESGFLTASVPCRMAHGRALAEDPVVQYVIESLRVILFPDDPIYQEQFLKVVLPRALFDGSRAKAEEERETLVVYLEQIARRLPREDGDRRKIWRGFYALRNLTALGLRHTGINSLVDELLSQRVGEYRTILEENHDDLTDPADHPEVVNLAARLESAFNRGETIFIPPLGGVEIAIKGILAGIGLNHVELCGIASSPDSQPDKGLTILNSDAPSLGIALAVFKAAQLIQTSSFSNRFRDFTAVDIETTDKDVTRAEIVEIAAVRVRNGRIIDDFHSLIKPRVPIRPAARKKHGISEHDLIDAPFFEDVWNGFREFCGRDLVVAHNGYEFDFPILRRMAESLPGCDLCTYDTLPLARSLHAGSCRLEDLARAYSIEIHQAHRALGDTKTLADVFLALGDAKVARARKTALDNLLDNLGVALALCEEESLCSEAARLKQLSSVFAFGRYSNCLEFYRAERERLGDESIPTLDDLIARLGGEQLMQKIRADKTAEQRYPAAMTRLRPLLDLFEGRPLNEQIGGFLERVALSKREGVEREPARVNLLTLHSTKGLEFSRVYIVGAEDVQFLSERNPSKRAIEEARRLMYVGITRTKDRLIFTTVDRRGGNLTGGHKFLDEMGLVPVSPGSAQR